MLTGKDGAAKFRSRYGGGHWVDPIAKKVGSINVGEQYTLEVPKNLAVDIGQRRVKGLVPALGLRVKGHVTPDNALVAQPLFMSKLQLASFLDFNIQNSYQTPYSQKMLDLAKWMIFAQIVNPDVEMLDQEFPTTPGGVSRSEIDLTTLGNNPFAGVAHGGGSVLGPIDTAYFGTKNGANYPTASRLDSYWRALESLIQIRSTTATVNYFDVVYSIPLCAGTGRLRSDVIPLETICDVNRPWQVQVKVNTDPNGKVIGFDSGTLTFDSFELFVYLIPIREEESREHGNPYQIRNKVRNGSPFLYEGDEVILFTGGIPDTQSTTTDTVDSRAYQRRIAYRNYATSLAAGVYQDIYADGEVYFPPYAKDRNPRVVYEGLWNSNPRRHQIRYAYDKDGTPLVVVRGGRDNLGQLNYQNIVDKTLMNLLGEVSPWPVQVFAATNLNMAGFPGFGTLTPNCKAPFITWESYVPGTDTWDIILNTTEVDNQYIQSLGGSCCDAQKPRFAPIIDKDSKKAGIVLSSGITTYEEVKQSDPAAASVPAADPSKSSLGQNPAGKAAQ